MSDLSDVKYTESDAFLMNTNFLKTTSYSKFGTYGYVVNLCMNSFSTINNAHKVATVDYFNAGERYGEKDSDVFGVDKGNNVMVIMMESLEWFGFGDGSYSARYNNLSNELTPNIYSLIAGTGILITSTYYDMSSVSDCPGRHTDSFIFLSVLLPGRRSVRKSDAKTTAIPSI